VKHGTSGGWQLEYTLKAKHMIVRILTPQMRVCCESQLEGFINPKDCYELMSYGNDNDLVNMTVTAIVAILLLTIIVPSMIRYLLPTPLSSVAHSLEYYEGLGWGLITMIFVIALITVIALIITSIRRFEGMPDW
jgi:hypothetical protein